MINRAHVIHLGHENYWPKSYLCCFLINLAIEWVVKWHSIKFFTRSEFTLIDDLLCIPNIRKLWTPQNEWIPIDWIYASLICNTSSFVNGIKIGLMVNGFFVPLIINTCIFGSKLFVGIVLSPSVWMEKGKHHCKIQKWIK